MNSSNIALKPQDVLLLLKIVSLNDPKWNQIPMARALGLSQSEISEAVKRAKYAGLLGPKGKRVMRNALMELLEYGIAYVFPQKPGEIVRGVVTAHSAPPLSEIIVSDGRYVWPWAKGNARGQAIIPLYPSVPSAVQNDPKLYELLALLDAVRVGKAREKSIAIEELRGRILPDEDQREKRKGLLLL